MSHFQIQLIGSYQNQELPSCLQLRHGSFGHIETLPLRSIAKAAKNFLQQFQSCQEEHNKGRQIQQCKCCHQNRVIIKANFDGAMIATRRAVIFSSKIGLQQCQFEGDSEIGIKALQMGDMFSSSFSHLVRDILILVTSLQSFFLSHIVRQGNAVHML